jgi:hypothetical protein
MGADAKIDLEKVRLCVHARGCFSCEPERDRDSSLATPSIPVGHRKDPWTGVPHPSSGGGYVATSPVSTAASITASRGGTMIVQIGYDDYVHNEPRDHFQHLPITALIEAN